MPTYNTKSEETSKAESGVKITDDYGDQNGNRLLFEDKTSWKLISGAGNSGSATSSDQGIYTTGQFQCMAIIIADFQSPNCWTAAHLLHVSSDRSAKIEEFFQNAGENSYAVIGGRLGSLKMMENIRNKYDSRVKNFWIYVSTGTVSPDFGMNNRGYFGETAS